MPTTSLAGDRSRRARNPRDITGRRYAEQQAEQAAKLKSGQAGPVAVADIPREEYKRGWSDGYDAGVAAVVRQLQVDEPGDEPQDAVSP